MITLQPNTVNNIAVTASELSTEETYFYLFRFFHVQENKDFVVQLDRLNPTSNRYDNFEFNPETLEMQTGKYKYWVYQSLTDGSTDYDGLVVLEKGKAWVPAVGPTNKNFKLNGTGDKKFKLQ